jgi:hypothetical protein
LHETQHNEPNIGGSIEKLGLRRTWIALPIIMVGQSKLKDLSASLVLSCGVCVIVELETAIDLPGLEIVPATKILVARPNPGNDKG